MNEWQEYVRRLDALPPDERATEIAKLSPEQRRALEEARAAGASFPPAPQIRKRKVWPWVVGCGCLPLGIVAVLFAIAVIGAGGFDELERQGRERREERERQEEEQDNKQAAAANETSAGDEQEQKEAQEQAVSATEVSAVDLVRQYDANEVAADQIFKGKLLLVDGTVENIGKDILDTMYVSLEGPEASFRSTQCYFSKEDANVLARLSPGQHVRLRGRCEGLFMNVQIKDCQVVE